MFATEIETMRISFVRIAVWCVSAAASKGKLAVSTKVFGTGTSRGYADDITKTIFPPRNIQRVFNTDRAGVRG